MKIIFQRELLHLFFGKIGKRKDDIGKVVSSNIIEKISLVFLPVFGSS